MSFADPFSGYSFLLRAIVYGVVPAFTILQFVRYRRALHIFQLEGYKRGRFVAWCRRHPARARFLAAAPTKKPLVMTGRAWRILVTATAITPFLVLVPAGVAHLNFGGWPADVATWLVAMVVVFITTPRIVILADVLMAPVQKAINARYLSSARARLATVNPLVVGITGSYGKTSTKFAIEKLIGPPGTALATPGSFNTPLGVCRTINEHLEPRHRFFVVEMGAYGEGEIAELMSFVRPSIGVLTAIGPVHLERFGSMDAIRRGKYEIVRDLPGDGVAVMNCDDPEVRALAEATGHVRVVRVGLDPAGAPDLTAADVEVHPRGTRFTIVESRSGERAEVDTKLLGRHSINHVLTAVAVGLEGGRSLAEIAAAIPQLEPVEHRLQLLEGEGGVTVIDDAYNSNPAGAAAALEVLSGMPGNKKVVVTPGIIELGERAAEENERFGRMAGEVADYVVVVARLNRDALVAGAEAGGRAEVITVDGLSEATKRLSEILGRGDVVLFENDLPDQYEG
ncbi:MAG TPA: UDP-N-acetylmuramoyl-tripeptide--D-alanyl-D-alanine ligase [Actinomycetota bacterium]|nr:UDP-N-acetylmuramoyl-tripeptide--D-alanyl-D-alanine ligase [Actinomycetota bacterium]